MPAEYAAVKLGGEPWCEYWYGVIAQVVEGISTEFDDVRVNRVLFVGISKQNDSR
jgi:hypothetical protein